MAATAQAKRYSSQVLKRLKAAYPDAECALNYSSPLQLLVATILSAQCTDARVNLVTKDLFKKYRTAQDFAQAKPAELEKAIQSTGFFRNKAKNILGCCQQLVEKHGGEVPQNLDDLVKLPGVGRKTGNVVLGTAFGIASGVVVDTHVTRVTHRLGMSKSNDAVKIEQELMPQIPKAEWVNFSHRVIHHGRRVCDARKPKCDICNMNDICPRIGVVTK